MTTPPDLGIPDWPYEEWAKEDVYGVARDKEMRPWVYTNAGGSWAWVQIECPGPDYWQEHLREP